MEGNMNNMSAAANSSSNTGLYIGLGVGAAVIGTGMFIAGRRWERKHPKAAKETKKEKKEEKKD